MILLDLPYVSEYLKETIARNQYPVFEPSGNLHFNPEQHSFCLTEKEAIEYFRKNPETRVYTNSENSTHWMIRNLGFTDKTKLVTLFKDKVAFRELTRSMYPNLYFRNVPFEEIKGIVAEELPFPCVIKPAIGFFSLGVYTVNHEGEWDRVKQSLFNDIQYIRNLYPTEVLDTARFIIEEYIYGDEYAFDAYFNHEGKPVILNILKHYFASGDDVSDRVYVTSRQIMRDNMGLMIDFLERLGARVEMKNFPLHVEVRIDEKGRMVPIEVNPMRFGGWCTTADNAGFAYGLNTYEYFLDGKKPDWDSILAQDNPNLYSLIVLNNSTGIPGKDIKSFDYERLLQNFNKPLELRKTDCAKFPLFGFIFTETAPENAAELDRILRDDLREYCNF
ncbi:MAG: ATP-grasp domain-containing protein [Bacteroidales bacterium]|nr:ATP-grasp domain-containing protein [Bacteroidales bacterium]